MLVTAYANGMSIGTPPGKNDHERAKRGAVKGWSAGAVRRHTRWLYGIDADGLDGTGVAYTLTLRRCPPHADDWARMVKLWGDRMREAGATRVHWVVEWQRPRVMPSEPVYGPQPEAPVKTSVPHLHAAVYWPEDVPTHAGIARGLMAWLDIASEYGAAWQGQDSKGIDGALGWLAYLSKHAARGVRHYQRSGAPTGWERTGRLWGKRGEWPVVEPERMHLSKEAGYRLRRLARSWRISDARAELHAALAAPVPPTARGRSAHAARIKTAKRRVSSARAMLRKGKDRSGTLGVSEWMGPDVLGPLLALLRAEGHVFLADGDGDVEWNEDWENCACGVRIARTAPASGHCGAAWHRRLPDSARARRALSRKVGSGAATGGSMRSGADDASGVESSADPIPDTTGLW